MALAKAKPFLPAEVHSNPDILSGVRGNRVPAMTIVAHVRDGCTDREIFEDYPRLPLDGIDAVRRWAAETGILLERA
jgi:uncharacterized protein (DUF433 family)